MLTPKRPERENYDTLVKYEGRIYASAMFTQEIMDNHGYNVINVEEGNYAEIRKRNKCFSALREFMATKSETQAGGGQMGMQVASDKWKRVLRFGDGQVPPAPPAHHVPGWVTIPDPTVPQQQQQRRWGAP